MGGRQVPLADHEDVWTAGLTHTLDRLAARAGRIVVLGDTPRSGVDPPVCLSAHLGDALACATPWSAAVDEASLAATGAAASAAGVAFVDTTPLVCSTDPCPVVVGRILVYRDGHHLTATYARGLADPLDELLGPVTP